MDTYIPFGVEEKSASFEIDKKSLKIEAKNYNTTRTKKSQIVLAGSLRGDSNQILRLKRKDFGLNKKWPMFTIRRDGKIFQHFDPQYYSDFMGNKDIDKKIITVMLENMGMVWWDNDLNSYVNWINEKCSNDLVYEKLFKANRYWEKYTEEQFKATVNLCVFLCRTYGINQDCEGNYASQENPLKYEGILTRANYDSQYSDLSPAFDYKRFLKELNIFI